MVACLYLTGCAGYRPASLPGSHSPGEVGDSDHTVEVGSQVKLTKTTGEAVSGKVVSISAEHLVLEQSGPDERMEQAVEFDQIASLEVKKGSSLVPVVIVGAALAVVVGAVVISSAKDDAAEATLQTLE